MQIPHTCLALAAFAAFFSFDGSSAHSAALVSVHDLNGDGITETFVTAEKPVLCFACVITHSISNGTLRTQRFNWTGLGWSARAQPAIDISFNEVRMEQTSYLPVAPFTGDVTFNPAGYSAPAQYLAPIPSELIFKTGDLVSKFFSSPEHISFESHLEELQGTHKYTYIVTNFDSSTVPFSWEGTGLSGSLAPAGTSGSSMSRVLFSDKPANEIVSRASFALDGDPITMPADYWQPAAVSAIPEPGSLALMFSGVSLVLLCRRGFRRAGGS